MSGSVSAKSLIDDLKRKRTIFPLAGKLAPREMLVDVVELEREYLERWPDVADPNQLVSFGTSGHIEARRIYAESSSSPITRISIALADRARG